METLLLHLNNLLIHSVKCIMEVYLIKAKDAISSAVHVEDLAKLSQIGSYVCVSYQKDQDTQ